MCRLYAHIAPSPASAADLLVASRCSLLAQSRVPRREQKDGWGVASYHGSGPRVVKSPGAAFREQGKFLKAAAGARSRIVVAHIRAASNPRRLPKRQLIGLENTQPFRHGRLVFAHNGTVEIPDAVLARLGPLARRVRGNNDSEVYFWQFVRHYRRTGSVGRALEDCVRELRELWRDPGVRRTAEAAGKKRPYSGLNTLVSDGRRLYALCHYPSRHTAQCSIRPWGRMAAARRNGRLVIASEPMDGGRWRDFREGELWTIESSGRVRRRPLRVP